VASGAIAADVDSVTEVVRPDWVVRTGANRVYPERALIAGKAGRGTLRCTVSKTLGLTACKVISEEPAGYGFGRAAIELADRFSLKPVTLDGAPVLPGMTVTLSIPFAMGKSSGGD